MGMPRNSYYDLFEPSSSAIAVVPIAYPHTYTMGITTVNTKADDAIKYLPEEKHYTKSAEMLTPDSYINYDRQRDTYEMLVDPQYRVYVALEDEEIHQELLNRLRESKFHYSPSLGLSECLAEISDVEVHSVEQVSTEAVDSAVYEDSMVVPQPEITIKRERAPMYMEATDGGGRRTTRFGNITYTADENRLPIDGSRASDVGPDKVLFR
jgi:CRISPR-associated protein Cas5h